MAQRSSSDRYRSSSGRLNHSDDTRPFRSPRLTSTFQPPARAGATGSRTSTTPIGYLPRRAPGATLPALNPSPGNRHSSHSRGRMEESSVVSAPAIDPTFSALPQAVSRLHFDLVQSRCEAREFVGGEDDLGGTRFSSDGAVCRARDGQAAALCARIQARAICAGVAPLAAATSLTISTKAMLAFRASGARRGTILRKSVASKIVVSSILPVRNPAPSGVNGPKPMQVHPGPGSSPVAARERAPLYCRNGLDGMIQADGLDTSVGQSEMLDLALSYQILHCPGHIFNRYDGVNAVLVEEVDPVGLQPLECTLGPTADVAGELVPGGCCVRVDVEAGLHRNTTWLRIGPRLPSRFHCRGSWLRPDQTGSRQDHVRGGSIPPSQTCLRAGHRPRSRPCRQGRWPKLPDFRVCASPSGGSVLLPLLRWTFICDYPLHPNLAVGSAQRPLSMRKVHLCCWRRAQLYQPAAQLGVSASAISQSIRHLEEALGLRLLTRTTRSVSVTEAGQRLLDTVGPRLDDIQAELTQLSALRDRPAGNVRITASE